MWFRSKPGYKRQTIRDCNLTDAELDFVTFSNCDLATLSLPRWPHFALLNPAAVAPRIQNPLNGPVLSALKAVAGSRRPSRRESPVTAGRFWRNRCVLRTSCELRCRRSMALFSEKGRVSADDTDMPDKILVTPSVSICGCDRNRAA